MHIEHLSTSQTKTKIIRTLRTMVDICKWITSVLTEHDFHKSSRSIFSHKKMHTRHGCPCHSTHYLYNIVSNKLPAPGTQLPVSKIVTAPEQRIHHHCNCCNNHWQPTIFLVLIQYYSQKTPPLWPAGSSPRMNTNWHTRLKLKYMCRCNTSIICLDET